MKCNGTDRMKIDKIIQSLRCCAEVNSDSCKQCPIRDEPVGTCGAVKAKAADLLDKYQEYIEWMEERISIMGECRDWISVDVSMPDDDVHVLTSDIAGNVYESWHEDGEWWTYFPECEDTVEDIVYWMPLPEAPKGNR